MSSGDAGRCARATSRTGRRSDWRSTRLDPPAEPHPDARLPLGPGPRSRWPVAPATSGCGTSPSGCSRPIRRGSRPRRRPGSGLGDGCVRSGVVRAGSPDDVGTDGVEVQIEGVRGRWRVEPELLDRPFEGRTALRLALRPARLRPRRHQGAVRLRVPARDLRAGGEAALGLLRAAGPPRRAARRPRRCAGRPQGGGAARAGAPPRAARDRVRSRGGPRRARRSWLRG